MMPMNTECDWCGTEFTQHQMGRRKRFCKNSCKQRAYESRKWGMAEIRRDWETLYSSCYLCGETLNWLEPQRIVSDHKIATVYARQTNPVNVKPVHLLCNARKGDKLLIELST